MADISLSNLTAPTPEPYDRTQPEKQRENLAYVLLQVFSLAKDAGFVIPDKAGLQSMFENVTLSVEIASLEGVETAIKDLKFNSLTFSLGNASFVFDGKTLTHITS